MQKKAKNVLFVFFADILIQFTWYMRIVREHLLFLIRIAKYLITDSKLEMNNRLAKHSLWPKTLVTFGAIVEF